MTRFPENVTWFPKIYKLYDKKVFGMLIGDLVSRTEDPIFLKKRGLFFKKMGNILGNPVTFSGN